MTRAKATSLPSGNLLHKVQSPSNLKSAWSELKKSPRSHGMTSETIEEFGNNLESSLRSIRKKLRQRTFQFGRARAMVKRELRPDGTIKPRPLRSPDIEDRVVQRAMARILYKPLNRKFKLDNGASFAYIRGLGVRDAMGKMILLARKFKNPVVFEADIVKFFDSVDHARLKKIILGSLPDSSLDDLLVQAVGQEIGNRDELDEKDKWLFPEGEIGIPQGGGLSPLLANVFLAAFDQRMLEQKFGLVRYADDFVVICQDKQEAMKAHALAVKVLEDELGLKIHELGAPDSKTRIVELRQDKFEFLGIRYNGNRLWPSDKKTDKLLARIDQICAYETNKNLLFILSKLTNLIMGWVSAYHFTDLKPCISVIETRINEHLGRSAFRMQWVRKYRSLTARQRSFSGVPPLDLVWGRAKGNLKPEQIKLFALN